jgi:two-component system, cell cycle response regulator
MTSRILVIEDNQASLELMLYLLDAFGYTPLSACDGAEGVEVARRSQPDLILCDVQLPKLNGYEVCRELKSDPALRAIPLVAVTAYAMVGDREKLLAGGFDGYISKPINPETFMQQVKPFLRTAPRAVTSQPTLPATFPAALKHTTILVLDNNLVNLRLSHSILEPFGYEVIDAHDVDEALALALEDRPDLIMSDVHMPVKDGFDFIRAVKADPQLSSIPFVFISSTLWGERERVVCLALGADRFILRPVEPQALVAEIESCLSEAKKSNQEIGGS